MKKVHQIYISDNNAPPSAYVASQMKKLKNMYSDYTYTLYDNEMCRNELRSAFGDALVMVYDSLNSYSFRADLARYCILYKHGGFYFDSIICPEFKLEFDHPVLYRAPVGSCDGYNAIDNGVMYFNAPKHAYLLDAMARCYENVKKKAYGVTPLDITGPIMLGRLTNEYDIRFGRSKFLDKKLQAIYKRDKAAYFGDEIHWLHKPSGSYLHSFGCTGINSYEDMWFNKQIFKD